MSIVRVGATKQYSDNWDTIFAGSTRRSSTKAKAASTKGKSTKKKSAKKKKSGAKAARKSRSKK